MFEIATGAIVRNGCPGRFRFNRPLVAGVHGKDSKTTQKPVDMRVFPFWRFRHFGNSL
jgi:hypothetical protein